MVYPAVPFRSLPGVLECTGVAGSTCGLTLAIVEQNVDAEVEDGDMEWVIARTTITATVREASIVGSIVERDVDTEV